MKNNEKRKSSLQHFITIGSGTVISVIISTITTPIITRLIDTTNYGKYSIFQLYANIALMILCLGLDQALMRFYYELKEDTYKKVVLKYCTFIPLIVTSIVSILAITLTYFEIINGEFLVFELILLSICVLFQIIHRMTLITLRLEFKSKEYSIINIIHKIVFVIVTIMLYYVSTIKGFYILTIAMTLSYIVSSIIAIVLQRSLWKGINVYNENVKLSKLLKYGLPYIISLGITTLFQAIDKISLNILYDYSEVGIYASAMTIVNIFAIIQTTFNALWTPLALKHYKKDSADTTFYIKVNNIITVVMFFMGITLILSKDIIAILLGKEYRKAMYILPCLIFNPIMYTISETTVCGIVFKEKSQKHLIIAIVSCVANIIGNVILVPILGGRGAAISTGIAYITFFVMRTVISNRYFKVKYELKKLYLITGLSFLYALYNTFIKFNYMTIIMYIILSIILVFIYFDTIKMIIKKILQYIKDKGVKI